MSFSLAVACSAKENTSIPIVSVPNKISSEQQTVAQTAVSVIDLYNEFKLDVQKASSKYNGKSIEVTGVVTYKGPDIHSTPSIELSTAVNYLKSQQ